MYRALSEFGKLDIIHVGGGWCGYTQEAKEYCIDNKIGIYVSDEMSGDGGKMSSGHTISEIKTEIRSIFTSLPEVSSVYGFGSFFRGEQHSDIDVMVVLSCDRQRILHVFDMLRKHIRLLGERLNVRFDLIVLTGDEFAEEPIRDMELLHLIYRAS